MGKNLSYYVSLQRGTTYRSALLGKPGPVLLGLASIARNGGFRSDNLKTYGGTSDPRMILGPGDVFVSLKDVTQSADLLGSVARVPNDIAQGRLTQDTVKLEFREGSPRDYIYWLLRTPDYRAYCQAHATGTTNLGLSRNDFFSFEVPELTLERGVVVSALEELEHKIELNRRMNKTLERMALAIFKDWFVNFGPVRRKLEGASDPIAIMGGLVLDAVRAAELAALFPDAYCEDGLPANWRMARVDTMLELVYGKSLPKTLREHGDIPVYGSGGINGYHIEPLASGPGIIVGRKGTVGSLYWVQSEFYAIDTVFYVRPREGYDLAFLWFVLQSFGLQHMNTDAAVPGLNRDNVYRLEFPVPPEKIRAQFSSFAGLLRNKIELNHSESFTLAETRDYLLPKLMAGDVRVCDADKITEASA